jgi:hypothetical protein
LFRGYKEVFLGEEVIKKDGSNMEEVKMKNALDHAELLINCESDLCFRIVESSRSEMFPEGGAA